MTAKRKILYVTGTRADFGLMASTLQSIATHPMLKLQIAVTGMHLSPVYGDTVRDIEALGLPIVARVPTDVEARTPLAMACGVGHAMVGLSVAIAEAQPDLVLVVGDRGEMLAGALAALHLGIPTVHLHGGERSGTIDESVRHAITKISHWHFVATEESRQRIVRMGEREDRIWVTGAPAVDGLDVLATTSREEILAWIGLPANSQYVLVLFHPVVQEVAQMRAQTLQLTQALSDVLVGQGIHVVWLAPNADAGSAEILSALQQEEDVLPVLRVTHLDRPRFIAAVKQARALVGNSSAGIIETASLGTPVVNIGTRQRGRERNLNTLDCGTGRAEIAAALRQALAHGPYPCINRYGDGNAGERIVHLLSTLPITPDLLDKVNTY